MLFPLPDFLNVARTHRPAWPRIRLAIQTTAAALLAYAGATYFVLPQGYWAVMTAMLVVQSNIGASLGLAMDRLLATVLGAAVGGGIVVLFGIAPSLTPVLLGAAVLLLAYVATFRASLRLAPVTAAIVILADPHYGSPLHSAANRVLEIGLGAAIAVAVSLLVFPSRAQKVLTAHVGRALPAIGEYLAKTIDTALGTADNGNALLTLGAQIRSMLATGNTLSDEMRREQTGHVAGGQADGAAIMRALRRLWYTSVHAGRAARMPLPQPALDLLAAPLVDLRDAVVVYVEALGSAYTGDSAIPDRARLEAALDAIDAAMNTLRQSGVARLLSTDDVVRVFAFTFALSQLDRNLYDLAERWAELRGEPRAPAETAPEIVA